MKTDTFAARLAFNLAALRNRRGLSVEQLADLSAINYRVLYRLSQGLSGAIAGKHVDQLATTLGVPLGALLKARPHRVTVAKNGNVKAAGVRRAGKR